MAINKTFVPHTELKAQDLNDLVSQANGYVAETKTELNGNIAAAKTELLTIYDISVAHTVNNVPAQYESLSAALGTNGANIPQDIRRGGMSVKFIQSYDSKYVQYRLMSDTFNTTPSNWQGVDDEPIAGSNNLVKSGGAFIKNIGLPTIIYGKAIDGTDGYSYIDSSARACTNFIRGGSEFSLVDGISLQYYYIYDYDGTFIERVSGLPASASINYLGKLIRLQFTKVNGTNFADNEDVFLFFLDVASKAYIRSDQNDFCTKSLYFRRINNGSIVYHPGRALSGYIKGKFDITLNSGFAITHYHTFNSDGTFIETVDTKPNNPNIITVIEFKKSDGTNLNGTEDFVDTFNCENKIIWDTINNNTIHINDAQQLTDIQKAQALANMGISGIDATPIAGSQNLVYSGGIYDKLIGFPEIIYGKTISGTDGYTLSNASTRAITNFIRGGADFGINDGINLQYFFIYDYDGTFIEAKSGLSPADSINYVGKLIRLQFSKNGNTAFDGNEVIFRYFSDIASKAYERSYRNDFVSKMTYFRRVNNGNVVYNVGRALSGYIKGKFDITLNTGFAVAHYHTFDLKGNYIEAASSKPNDSNLITVIEFKKSDGTALDGTEDFISAFDCENKMLWDAISNIPSSSISYDNSKTLLPSNNVDGALENLSDLVLGSKKQDGIVTAEITYENGSIDESTGANNYNGASTRLRTVGYCKGSDFVSLTISNSAPSDFKLAQVFVYALDGSFESYTTVDTTSYSNRQLTNKLLRFKFSGTHLSSSYSQYITVLQIERNSIIGLIEKQPINIENDIVRAYWKNVRYYNHDFSVSYITDYTGDTYYRTDEPQDVILKNYVANAAVCKVYATPNATEALRTINIADGSFVIENLEPSKVYFYKILDSSNNVLRKGTLNVEGTIRMVKTDSLRNVRDIGGTRTSDGKTIRYGRIIRGCRIDNINQKDVAILRNQIGITAHLNLETDSESSLTESPLGSDISYFHNGGSGSFINATADATQIAKAVQNVKQVASWLASGKNIYIHCWGGADRTGYLIFLIEMICGVCESDIDKLYELTSFSSYGIREITDNTTWMYRTTMEAFYAMDGGTIQEKVTNFLITNGVTTTEVAQIRSALVYPL